MSPGPYARGSPEILNVKSLVSYIGQDMLPVLSAVSILVVKCANRDREIRQPYSVEARVSRSGHLRHRNV